MDDLEKFLYKHNFDKKLKQLEKRLKNKTLILYGAGKFFEMIIKKYDLSKLNIIGITDKKYLIEDAGKNNNGYKIIPYSYYNSNLSDYTLLMVQNPRPVLKSIKNNAEKNKIIPIVTQTLLEKITSKIKSLSTYFSRKNTLVVIKSNGEKIHNPRIKNLKITSRGKNNYIEIHEPFTFKNEVLITMGNNSKVKINAFNNYNTAKICMGSNNYLEIGENTTIENATMYLINCKNTKIKIGKDCMFSYGITLRTSDTHSIYELSTKKLENSPRDITIGNHVWITAGVTILKGCVLGSNCIVGANSVVSKAFTEENCILAGIPAKIIKKGVNWDRSSPHNFI